MTVILWMPSHSWLALSVASPPLSVALPKICAPSAKVTMPLGSWLLSADVTIAVVQVTRRPIMAGLLELCTCTTVVVVGVAGRILKPQLSAMARYGAATVTLVLNVARDGPGALRCPYISRSKQGAPTVRADRIYQ
jgi:hypothetical protein